MPNEFITIQYDKAKLERITRVLSGIPKALPRVISSAINRTLKTTKTFASRLIASEVKPLRKSDVTGRLFTDRASRRGWMGRMVAGTKPFGMERFAYAQQKAGVPFRVIGGRLMLARAFKVEGRNPVFIRATAFGEKERKVDWETGEIEGGEQELVGRLPIIALKGPTASELLLKIPGALEKTSANAEMNLIKHINSGVNYELSKLPR